jgi:hypothetical protein
MAYWNSHGTPLFGWMKPWENPWATVQGHFILSVQIGPKKKNK